MRKAGQDVGRIGDDALRLIGLQLSVCLAAQLTHALRASRQHRVNKQAVALGGGHAAGRGVRADDQAQLFQVGHDVADGGSRQVQARRARQGARANRLAIGNVALDQRFQQDLGTVIQHGCLILVLGRVFDAARSGE